MAEISTEIRNKLQQILGIPPEGVDEYEVSELINELCDTVFMLDEQKSVSQITALREKITSINGRIWSLLGEQNSKKAREDFGGIASLERYVGELKRSSGKLQNIHERDKELLNSTENRQDSSEKRLTKLEDNVFDLQEDLQKLFSTFTDLESLEEDVRQAGE